MRWSFVLVVLLLVNFSSALVLLSDQGTDVRLLDGTTLSSGDLNIKIYDSVSGGALIYNNTFSSAIVNGSWNVQISADLEYGKSYWKDYAINGDDLDFDGNERIEFQSPLGLINNASLFNFSLIGSCASGSSIRGIFENGSVICEVDDFGAGGSQWSISGSEYLYNDSGVLAVNESALNLSIDARGVGGDNSSWNQSLADGLYIAQGDENNLDVNSSVFSNSTTWWASLNDWLSGWFVNNGGTLEFNETKLNETIDLRAGGDNSSWNESYADGKYSLISEPLWSANFTLYNSSWSLDSDTTYSHLGNFTDDLGDRGYTNNLNFSNGANYWNNTYATFNKTYADGLYAELQWGYNQTTPAITWSNDTIQANNASWVSTYNSTYDSKADYQFAGNNFNGSGNFTTSGNLHINSTVDTVLILEADTDDSNEADNPYILMHQDGGTTNVVIGLTGVEDEDPAGNELNDTSTNDLIIHHLEDEGIQFGVDNDLKAEFRSTFNQFFQDTYFTDDVGIGTSSPRGKLHVNISGNDNVIIWENENVQAALWVNSNSAGIGTVTGNDLGFFTNDGSYSMILKNGSGNVGIGTTNPLAKLDVRVTSGGAATIGDSDNSATGYASVALGSYANASGDVSIAMGEFSTTSGEGSIAMGYDVSALGFASIAMGEECIATNEASIAMGYGANSSGIASMSMGYSTIASGLTSTAMGYSTIASGLTSTVMGREIQAGGEYVFAIGLDDMNGTDCAQDNSMCIMGGDVGIGIAAPTSKLHVIGTVNATSFIGDYIRLNGISSPPMTCNSSSDGTIYYDSDVKRHCSCNSTAWVQMDDYSTGCS